MSRSTFSNTYLIAEGMKDYLHKLIDEQATRDELDRQESSWFNDQCYATLFSELDRRYCDQQQANLINLLIDGCGNGPDSHAVELSHRELELVLDFSEIPQEVRSECRLRSTVRSDMRADAYFYDLGDYNQESYAA